MRIVNEGNGSFGVDDQGKRIITGESYQVCSNVCEPNGRPDEAWEVVSTYTDAQAVEDGVLVAISKVNRVTRAAFDWMCEHADVSNMPENEQEIARDGFARMTSSELIKVHGLEARRVYEQNIGGGIFTLSLSGCKAWIMPNELGGLTLMFPEDY